jgi:hypothetical protein
LGSLPGEDEERQTGGNLLSGILKFPAKFIIVCGVRIKTTSNDTPLRGKGESAHLRILSQIFCKFIWTLLGDTLRAEPGLIRIDPLVARGIARSDSL